MAHDVTGVTEGAALIPELWTNSVADYMQNLVGLVNMVEDYSSLVSGTARKGDVIHVPSFPKLTAETVAENATIEAQAVTVTDNSITLNQHFTCVFDIEDIAEVQARESLMAAYVHHAGEALYYAQENYIAGTLLTAATTNDVALATDNTMTSALFLSGIGKLLTYDVPLPKDSYFAASPLTYVSLISLAEMNAYEKTGAAGSKVVSVHGYEIPLYSSTCWDQAGGANAEAASMWHKSAVGFARQQEPSFMSSNKPRTLSIEAAVSAIYGGTLFFEERVANWVQLT